MKANTKNKLKGIILFIYMIVSLFLLNSCESNNAVDPSVESDDGLEHITINNILVSYVIDTNISELENNLYFVEYSTAGFYFINTYNNVYDSIRVESIALNLNDSNLMINGNEYVNLSSCNSINYK